MSLKIVCPHCLQVAAVVEQPAVPAAGKSQAMQELTGVVGQYLAERCTEDSTARVESTVLVADAHEWLNERGVTTSNNALGRALSYNGVKSMKSQGRRYYTGIAHRSPH